MAKELLEGNAAIAEAAIRAGVEAFFGYPITPQTEVLEVLSERLPEEGRVFLQAESEVASINMVYGAACTGVRVMTSSSSPGISLMQEGLSYIACSEVPVVIVNVMRGGPGLGNIQPSQGDYFQAVKSAGHGDFHNIVPSAWSWLTATSARLWSRPNCLPINGLEPEKSGSKPSGRLQAPKIETTGLSHLSTSVQRTWKRSICVCKRNSARLKRTRYASRNTRPMTPTCCWWPLARWDASARQWCARHAQRA
jgi:hypothetical protein